MDYELKTLAVRKISRKFSELLLWDYSECEGRTDLRDRLMRGEHANDLWDANMIMDEAYTHVLGHEMDASNEAHAALWDEAWNLAMAENYYWRDIFGAPYELVNY